MEDEGDKHFILAHPGKKSKGYGKETLRLPAGHPRSGDPAAERGEGMNLKIRG